ncbi:MAG TPA: SDR family oxidoreductase [Steroidobacteraceae bacterium]|nr:SDR family oxidoreductase [Steroidobacteraceae bacterium]
MRKIVVITDADAGVGRAAATEFARNGCDVALLSCDPAKLERAAVELEQMGARALPIPTDMADAKAVDAAAERVERELGPMDAWVNVAMGSVSAPVHRLTAEEFLRGTAVTYLGQVHGTMAAVRHMRPRNRGTIVSVGSAFAYRALPSQSMYWGAKFAIHGFLDALRSDLYHDKVKITLTALDLPAENTPQFDWTIERMGELAQSVPRAFPPEVAARAIYRRAFRPRWRIWMEAFIANRIAPGLLDRYLAKFGPTGRLSDWPSGPDAPGNLFEPVTAAYRAHGRFDHRARTRSWEKVAARKPKAISAAGLIGVSIIAYLLIRRARVEPARRAALRPRWQV